MVKVTLKDGKFSVKGTFDFGYIGLLKDDEFNIHYLMEEEIITDREGESWEETAEIFGIKGTSDDDIADALTVYINEFEARIQKNKNYLNNGLIAKIAENWEDCGFDFWRAHDDLLVPEYLSYEDNLYIPEIENKISQIVSDWVFYDYLDIPYDSSKERIDAEAAMREIFPMFNWDKFLSNIKTRIAGLSYNGNLFFEIDDDFGCHIFCSAVADVDKDLRLLRWDNF